MLPFKDAVVVIGLTKRSLRPWSFASLCLILGLESSGLILFWKLLVSLFMDTLGIHALFYKRFILDQFATWRDGYFTKIWQQKIEPLSRTSLVVKLFIRVPIVMICLRWLQGVWTYTTILCINKWWRLVSVGRVCSEFW